MADTPIDIDSLSVRVITPEKLIWEGEARSVSSINNEGPFDILPLHTNFITIIENTPIKVDVRGAVQEYSFSRCVIYAHENKVTIYGNL